MNHETLTLQEAAERAGVSPSTLRRWAASGVFPQVRAANGEDWTPAAASHARVVARLRHRGHKLEEIREATKQGRLAYGFLEDMFPDSQGTRTLEDAVEATGLQPALIDGDYFGREVNLASRIVARARGGEVLVSDAVVERVAESEHLVFQGVGQVKLKGFNETVQLCRAQTPEGQ